MQDRRTNSPSCEEALKRLDQVRHRGITEEMRILYIDVVEACLREQDLVIRELQEELKRYRL
jgi:hypothetical protein